MVAPLPVKTFDRASDLLAHYAAVNKRVWAPVSVPAPAAQPKRKITFRATRSLIAKMREMRAAGGSYRDIAKECGCHQSTVARFANDIPPPPGGFKVGGHARRLPREAIMKRFHAGYSFASIDRHFDLAPGVSWKVITRTLRERARPRRSIDRLVRLVVAVTQLSWLQLGRPAVHHNKGSKRIGRARHILFWLIRRELPKVSYLTMARELGGFDHTSCLYGVKRVDRAIKALEIDPATPALKIARLLWKLDWPERTAK